MKYLFVDLSAEGLQVKYWTTGEIFVCGFVGGGTSGKILDPGKIFFVDLSAEGPQVKYWTTGKIFVCGFVGGGTSGKILDRR